MPPLATIVHLVVHSYGQQREYVEAIFKEKPDAQAYIDRISGAEAKTYRIDERQLL